MKIPFLNMDYDKFLLCNKNTITMLPLVVTIQPLKLRGYSAQKRTVT